MSTASEHGSSPIGQEADVGKNEIPGWSFRWVPNKSWRRPGEGQPQHWARWNHPSGYSIGEVDAGRYMAALNGEGLVDETGDYAAWAHPEQAAEYVEAIIHREAIAEGPVGRRVNT
jgi:hypothetical protein